MSERLPSASNPFSGRVVAILMAIGVISLAGVLTLMAWSPDLASRDRAGPTPYSRSATGYSGLTDMLEARGLSTSISRLEQTVSARQGSLLILTLPLNGRTIEVDEIAAPALIVLPKWDIFINPTKRSWEIYTEPESIEMIDASLGLIEEDARLARIDDPREIDTPFGTFRPQFEDKLQVIRSDTLVPVISVRGGDLVARLPGTQIYILSDPDLINNFGLARLENARAGIGLIEYLADDNRAVVFDATLHGFERSTNLMKILLDVPFIGATLIALATILLIGWAAAIRFGAPERETRAISFGKQALADNSAGLISMARREKRMAPGYLALSRRALSRELGLPRTLSAEEYMALLDRMGEQAGLDRSFSSHNQNLSHAANSRDDLRQKARALWRWRKEMTHGN